MKTMRRYIPVLFLALVMGVFATGCKKYEEPEQRQIALDFDNFNSLMQLFNKNEEQIREFLDGVYLIHDSREYFESHDLARPKIWRSDFVFATAPFKLDRLKGKDVLVNPQVSVQLNTDSQVDLVRVFFSDQDVDGDLLLVGTYLNILLKLEKYERSLKRGMAFYAYDELGISDGGSGTYDPDGGFFDPNASFDFKRSDYEAAKEGFILYEDENYSDVNPYWYNTLLRAIKHIKEASLHYSLDDAISDLSLGIAIVSEKYKYVLVLHREEHEGHGGTRRELKITRTSKEEANAIKKVKKLSADAGLK